MSISISKLQAEVYNLNEKNVTLNEENDKLNAENDKLNLEVLSLKEALHEAKQKLYWFHEQIRLSKIHKFHKKTDTTEQLSLFDADENDGVTEAVDEEKETITYKRTKRKSKNGRNIDTSKLPREQQIHDLSEEEKTCSCGCELTPIGKDISEQLSYVPAELKVIEHIQHKYTCRHCDTIKSAKKPAQPIAKCLAASSLIAEVIIKKYDHHLPFYRQSKIWSQIGIDIPDNTLGNWAMKSAELLSPIGDALWQQLLKIRLLQADETTVKILQYDKKGYMWAYHSLDPGNRFVTFEFNLSRSAAVPESRLKGFKGILQTDGYSGYNSFRNHPDIVNIGCWDHGRRKIVDAIKVNNGNASGISGRLLKLINKLYKIERELKKHSIADRRQARLAKAVPVLDQIYTLISKVNILPKSSLGAALTYLKNNQPYLTAYVNYGDTQISNCLVENHIRPFALGRKNWLFVGNDVSANRSALLYSLIQTCKINNIDARRYLIAVLDRVHAIRRGAIDPEMLLPQFIDKSIL